MPADSLAMTNAHIPLSQRKLVALDGVRGLAIVAVMLTHIAMQTVALNPTLRAIFALGWSGVDLFFVLSGFLITGILLDTRECSNYFRSFYPRRVMRIFPLYNGFLIVALLVFPYIVSPDVMPDRSTAGCICAIWQIGYRMHSGTSWRISGRCALRSSSIASGRSLFGDCGPIRLRSHQHVSWQAHSSFDCVPIIRPFGTP